MAYDLKYGKVTTEHCAFSDDTEPVVVFRAQDKILPKLLAYYHMFCMQEHCLSPHLDTIIESRDKVMAWQSANWHKVKIPDSK